MNKKSQSHDFDFSYFVFTNEQEKMILETIFSMSDMGVGLDVISLRKIVQNFVRSIELQTPFKDDLPGIDWLYR